MEHQSTSRDDTVGEQDITHSAAEPTSGEDRNVPVQLTSSAIHEQTISDSNPKEATESTADQPKSDQMRGERPYYSTPCKKTEVCGQEHLTASKDVVSEVGGNDDANPARSPITQSGEQGAGDQTFASSSQYTPPRNSSSVSAARKASAPCTHPGSSDSDNPGSGLFPKTADVTSPLSQEKSSPNANLGDPANTSGHDPASSNTSRDNHPAGTNQPGEPSADANLEDLAGTNQPGEPSMYANTEASTSGLNPPSPSTSRDEFIAGTRQPDEPSSDGLGNRGYHPLEGIMIMSNIKSPSSGTDSGPNTGRGYSSASTGRIVSSSDSGQERFPIVEVPPIPHIDAQPPVLDVPDIDVQPPVPNIIDTYDCTRRMLDARRDEAPINDRGRLAMGMRHLRIYCPRYTIAYAGGIILTAFIDLKVALAASVPIAVGAICYANDCWISHSRLRRFDVEEMKYKIEDLVQYWGRFYISEDYLRRRLDITRDNKEAQFQMALLQLLDKNKIRRARFEDNDFYSWISSRPPPPRVEGETTRIRIEGNGLAGLNRATVMTDLDDRMALVNVRPIERPRFNQDQGFVSMVFDNALDASAVFNELHKQVFHGIPLTVKFV